MSKLKKSDCVFVYGSLLSGFRNNYLLGLSICLGPATLKGATLYDLEAFPALKLEGEGEVIGEVYQLAHARVGASLDMLERYPTGYGRTIVETSRGNAWVYFMPHDLPPQRAMASGNWRSHIEGKN